jgi:hypothetical protein
MVQHNMGETVAIGVLVGLCSGWKVVKKAVIIEGWVALPVNTLMDTFVSFPW